MDPGDLGLPQIGRSSIHHYNTSLQSGVATCLQHPAAGAAGCVVQHWVLRAQCACTLMGRVLWLCHRPFIFSLPGEA